METDDERAARGAGLASTVRALSAVVLVLNSLFCALVSSDCLMSRSTWLCLLAEGGCFYSVRHRGLRGVQPLSRARGHGDGAARRLQMRRRRAGECRTSRVNTKCSYFLSPPSTTYVHTTANRQRSRLSCPRRGVPLDNLRAFVLFLGQHTARLVHASSGALCAFCLRGSTRADSRQQVGRRCQRARYRRAATLDKVKTDHFVFPL